VETAVGEGEVVGEGAVRAEMDFPAIDGDFGTGNGSAVEDELGVDVHGEGAVLASGDGTEAGGETAGAELEEAAAEGFGDLEGADAEAADEIAAEVFEDAIGEAGGDDAAEGVGEREGVAVPLEAGEGLGEPFAGAHLVLDQVEELAEGVVEGDGDEFDFPVGGGVVAGGEHLVGHGELMERAVVPIVAELGLEEGGGAVNGEVPLLGAGEDLNLVDAFGAGNVDLQKDFAPGGFLFGIAELLPAKVPVGVKPAGIAGGEKNAAGAVTFGQFSQRFKGGEFRFGGGGGERLEDEFVG
jgi:hypothetical protein